MRCNSYQAPLHLETFLILLHLNHVAADHLHCSFIHGSIGVIWQPEDATAIERVCYPGSKCYL